LRKEQNDILNITYLTNSKDMATNKANKGKCAHIYIGIAINKMINKRNQMKNPRKMRGK